MKDLAKLVLDLGGNMLSEAIGKQFGNTAEGLSRIALEALGKAFGVKADPEIIQNEINSIDNPAGVREIIRLAERDFLKEKALIANDLKDYRDLLQADNKLGLLSRIWRPIFALVYSACFFLIIFTISQAVWTSNIEGINAMINLSGIIIALFTTGAAVLGVYVWGRTGEKKLGVA